MVSVNKISEDPFLDTSITTDKVGDKFYINFHVKNKPLVSYLSENQLSICANDYEDDLFFKDLFYRCWYEEDFPKIAQETCAFVPEWYPMDLDKSPNAVAVKWCNGSVYTPVQKLTKSNLDVQQTYHFRLSAEGSYTITLNFGSGTSTYDITYSDISSYLWNHNVTQFCDYLIPNATGYNPILYYPFDLECNSSLGWGDVGDITNFSAGVYPCTTNCFKGMCLCDDSGTNGYAKIPDDEDYHVNNQHKDATFMLWFANNASINYGRVFQTYEGNSTANNFPVNHPNTRIQGIQYRGGSESGMAKTAQNYSGSYQVLNIFFLNGSSIDSEAYVSVNGQQEYYETDSGDGWGMSTDFQGIALFNRMNLASGAKGSIDEFAIFAYKITNFTETQDVYDNGILDDSGEIAFEPEYVGTHDSLNTTIFNVTGGADFFFSYRLDTSSDNTTYVNGTWKNSTMDNYVDNSTFDYIRTVLYFSKTGWDYPTFDKIEFSVYNQTGGEACTPIWVNGSKTDWFDGQSSICNVSDETETNQTRWWNETDSNECAGSGTTEWNENQTVVSSCNNCSMNQTGNSTHTWDSNWENCCKLTYSYTTGDCYQDDNITYSGNYTTASGVQTGGGGGRPIPPPSSFTLTNGMYYLLAFIIAMLALGGYTNAKKRQTT